MAEERLKIPSGAVLVAVNIDKFKWCYKGSDIKNGGEVNGDDPRDLVVKDLPLSQKKPSKWKSIKECVFRVKKLASSSKLTSTYNLKEGGVLYYEQKAFLDSLKNALDVADEIEVLLARTYCLGYSYNVASTKATETLKTTCGSISSIGKQPEHTVEFSGYSVRETSENKEELLETYIERSHFQTFDVVKENGTTYKLGKLEKPKNYEFIVFLVNQIQSKDQRTKFIVAEGQIATFNPAQDLSNQKIDLKCQVTLSKPLVSLSYDYIEGAVFFEI
ncbi:hypothetical protein F0310_04370 (plasmid) [Borrelia sp. A-FGy1]|uniref:hypothetical protein n=1 Tax=Borrelia sp. A-FGy1 TaxID=2608247 RepID=UPI0015F76B14|nr:hypothetical protein [Borrelia sp. A-FGy1]QMU99652.1 hypothetical protein F0310_04370 [Borrelia sp. A-FGy1]